MCGLSVGFAFKTGLFNIGASGQYTVGAFLRADLRHPVPDALVRLPDLAGRGGRRALGRHSPACSRRIFNVNEVITAIMFNWIGHVPRSIWLLGNMPKMLATAWGAVQPRPHGGAGARPTPDADPAQDGLWTS